MDQAQPSNPQAMQQAAQVFNQSHHAAYESLRGIAMKMLGLGVPGMEDVVNAITKAHTGQIQKSRLATPGGYQAVPTQMPQQALGQATGAAMGQQVPQAQQPQVPQAYGPGF